MVHTRGMDGPSLSGPLEIDLADRGSPDEPIERSLIKALPSAVLLVRPDRVIRYASPAVRLLLDCEPHDLVGRMFGERLHPDDLPAVNAAFRRIVHGTSNHESISCRARFEDGTYRWRQLVGTNRTEDEALGGVVVSVQDIDSLMETAETYRQQSLHDPLTGLANRALVQDRLKGALLRARRHDSRLGVLYIDLDGFKEINDNHGHQVGDEVLCEVARRLTTRMRATDTVGRLGGDEFITVIEDLRPALAESDARRTAESVEGLFATPMRLSTVEVQLNASVGVALSDGRDEPAVIMAEADLAMYARKASNRRRPLVSPSS